MVTLEILFHQQVLMLKKKIYTNKKKSVFKLTMLVIVQIWPVAIISSVAIISTIL